MQRFYLSFLLLLTTPLLWSQSARTWVGPASGGSWNNAGNWSDNAVPATGDIIRINGGFSGNINDIPSVQLGGLRIEGNSTVTLNILTGNDRTLNINGPGDNVNFFIESGSSLVLAGGSNDDLLLEFRRSSGPGNAMAAVDGTLVVKDNAALAWDFGNTAITVSGAIENTGGSVATNNNLSFTSTGIYRHQRNGGSLPNASWNSTSLCEITGITTTGPGSLNQEFGHFTWNCPSQTGNISFNAGLQHIGGNLTIESTGSGEIWMRNAGGPSSGTTINGAFILNGGRFVINGGGSTHSLLLNGDVMMTGGTLACTGGNANFVFDNNVLQTFTKTGGAISGAVSFRIGNNAVVDFGSSVLDGSNASFLLDDNAHIIVSHKEGLYSHGNSGAIQVGGNRSYSHQGLYEFRGSSTGTFSTPGNDVKSLIINNTSGEVMLERSFDISGELAMLNGFATTSISNIITVGVNGSATTSNGAYVNGPMRKQQNSSSLFIFPVGKPESGLNPVTIQTSGGEGNSTFTAEYLRQNPTTAVANGTTYGSGIARVSSCDYWALSRVGSRNAFISLSWNESSSCGPSHITNLSAVRIARHTGTTWSDAGRSSGANGGSTATRGSITSATALDHFGMFALATSNVSNNPLPVMFEGVKAIEKNKGVQIEWSNLTERDIVRYEVERSGNGTDFYGINQQLPKSNRDDNASYSCFDDNPLAGANYYRIRVDEMSGKMVYSKIMRVEIGTVKLASFKIYPNPVTDRQLTVSLDGIRSGRYSLDVFNAAGQRVYSGSINNTGEGITQMVVLPAGLKSGMYIAILSNADFRESRQIVLR